MSIRSQVKYGFAIVLVSSIVPFERLIPFSCLSSPATLLYIPLERKVIMVNQLWIVNHHSWWWFSFNNRGNYLWSNILPHKRQINQHHFVTMLLIFLEGNHFLLILSCEWASHSCFSASASTGLSELFNWNFIYM